VTGARVTVGMPVKDGGEGFERQLQAILGQTARDIEVVVSDNGSSDATAAVIAAAVEADPRVRALRQEPPVGVWDNFRAVLAEARTPYFMWAAADDLVNAEYVERTAAVLDARPDVVLAIADTELVAADGTRKPSPGSFALEGTERENVAALLEAPIDNSRVYGLFRREALVRAIPDEEFFAMDWAIAIATLREGRHAVAAGATLVRTDSDTEKYLRLIEVYTPPGPARLVGLWPFTRYLLRRLRPPLSAGAAVNLLRLNAWVHMAYCRWRHPAYGAVAERVASAAEAVRLRLTTRPG